MNYEHLGKAPRVDPSARVAPNATLCGEVTIGANTAIGFGAVLTAESGPIVVGANCVIMDTAVIRGIRDYPVTIGDNVLVGPRAYLTGCTVEDNAFLATGCSVFNGAHIGERAEVCINGVVHIRTVLAADATVPIGWIAVGIRLRSCRQRITIAFGPNKNPSTSPAPYLASTDRRKGNRSCRTSCPATPTFSASTVTTAPWIELDQHSMASNRVEMPRPPAMPSVASPIRPPERRTSSVKRRTTRIAPEAP